MKKSLFLVIFTITSPYSFGMLLNNNSLDLNNDPLILARRNMVSAIDSLNSNQLLERIILNLPDQITIPLIYELDMFILEMFNTVKPHLTSQFTIKKSTLYNALLGIGDIGLSSNDKPLMPYIAKFKKINDTSLQNYIRETLYRLIWEEVRALSTR